MLLLTSWISIGDLELIGADLNQTMALLPGVAALAMLIALYRKLPRLLFFVSSIALAAASGIALTADLTTSPAVIQARERISGIAGGGDVVIGTSVTPTVFGIAGVILAVSTAALIFFRPRQAQAETDGQEPDARELWDQQSE